MEITLLRAGGTTQVYVRNDEDDEPIFAGAGGSDQEAIADAINTLEETLITLRGWEFGGQAST